MCSSDLILPPTYDVDMNAWADARAAESFEQLDGDVAESVTDDGHLFHGRAPSEDVDSFNPHVIAVRRPCATTGLWPPVRLAIVPPPVTEVA